MNSVSSTSDVSELTLSENCAVFLDFDGTLADIQLHPDRVFMPEATRQAIISISDYLDGAVAIISGRDIRDLSMRVPSGLWRIGGHGLELLAPHSLPNEEAPELPTLLYHSLKNSADAVEGVRLEVKGAIAALHYRQAPEAEAHCVNAVKSAIAKVTNYTFERGKMVVEAKPTGVNKGVALARLMDMSPFRGRQPIMIGDDVTDESAFKTALDLGGVAVKVGDGRSCAPLRAQNPAAVHRWIEREAAKMERSRHGRS